VLDALGVAKKYGHGVSRIKADPSGRFRLRMIAWRANSATIAEEHLAGDRDITMRASPIYTNLPRSTLRHLLPDTMDNVIKIARPIPKITATPGPLLLDAV
jgi:hypothetical protein